MYSASSYCFGETRPSRPSPDQNNRVDSAPKMRLPPIGAAIFEGEDQLHIDSTTMLVLVVGDAHIPERASSIPEPIAKLSVPGKFDQVVSVGNISDAATSKLMRQLAPSRPLSSVPGSSDVSESSVSLSHVFEANKFKIGVVASFEIIPAEDIDSLSAIARKLDVDILLWGGSHRQNTQSFAGHYFVNPGSLTGALVNWNPEYDVEPAGFCLLDVTDDVCTVYMYSQKDDDNVTVSKTQSTLPSRD